MALCCECADKILRLYVLIRKNLELNESHRRKSYLSELILLRSADIVGRYIPENRNFREKRSGVFLKRVDVLYVGRYFPENKNLNSCPGLFSSIKVKQKKNLEIFNF